MILEIAANNDDEISKVYNNVSEKVGVRYSAIVTIININSPTPNFPITTTGNQYITLKPNVSTINFISITVFSININTRFVKFY